jgi:hypothetical protein
MFKWRQTEPGLILYAVRWYLRYSLLLRDVEELLEERGLRADHDPEVLPEITSLLGSETCQASTPAHNRLRRPALGCDTLVGGTIDRQVCQECEVINGCVPAAMSQPSQIS